MTRSALFALLCIAAAPATAQEVFPDSVLASLWGEALDIARAAAAADALYGALAARDR